MATLSGLLGVFALIAVSVALVAIARRRVEWARIRSRRQGWWLLAGSLAALVGASAMSPPSSASSGTPTYALADRNTDVSTSAAPATSVALSSPSTRSTSPPAAVPSPRGSRAPDGSALPDRELTPGEVFAAATRAQICVPGYSSGVRAVSSATRQAVFTAYGLASVPHDRYELDHLVPLELGGDNSARNLWPEPRSGPGAASLKDHLENHLHALVCAGVVPLAEAQQAMEGDWWAANTKYGAMSVPSTGPVTAPSTGPVTAPSVAPAPPVTSAPALPAGPATFTNCAALRAQYPHGVGRSGAVDHTTGRPVTTFTVNDALYQANRGLDGDGDGIACEKR